MAAQLNRFDTDLRRGDCWSIDVTWRPGGELIDMDGYTAEFSITWERQRSSSGGYFAAGSVDADPVIDTDTGIVSVNLEAEETLAIPPAPVVVYQLRLTDPDGCKVTIATGSLTIYQDYIGD